MNFDSKSKLTKTRVRDSVARRRGELNSGFTLLPERNLALPSLFLPGEKCPLVSRCLFQGPRKYQGFKKKTFYFGKNRRRNTFMQILKLKTLAIKN